jgi:hypothetical protein
VTLEKKVSGYLLYWNKITNTAPNFSVYLLYWYKSTSTDASSPPPHTQRQRYNTLAGYKYLNCYELTHSALCLFADTLCLMPQSQRYNTLAGYKYVNHYELVRQEAQSRRFEEAQASSSLRLQTLVA